MQKTVFKIPKMDCPSEERLIRMAVDGKPGLMKIEFNLPGREVTLYHDNQPEQFLSLLEPLNFGTQIISTELIDKEKAWNFLEGSPGEKEESRTLKIVFGINALMFLVEIIVGLLAQSTSLLADSLDMFADASVFALSIYAVGKAIILKKRAARISGYLQMALALGALSEVIRKFILGSEPEAHMMIGVASIALVANAVCMWLLVKYRKGEVHMQASWIFLSNDVIANAGVILAGVLVAITKSHIPDLVVGGAIAAVVFCGAIRILRLSKR